MARCSRSRARAADLHGGGDGVLSPRARSRVVVAVDGHRRGVDGRQHQRGADRRDARSRDVGVPPRPSVELRLDGRPVAHTSSSNRRAHLPRDRPAHGPARRAPAGFDARRRADGGRRRLVANGDPRRLSFAIGTWNWPVRGRTPMRRRSTYRDFWAGVGERFPDLDGAASTRYYSDNERRLFTEHFPPLEGLRILKTDLWDEAKNTRILAWASRQGAPLLRHRHLRAHGEPGARGVRRRPAHRAAGRGRRRARPAVSRRELRRHLFDGHDRALRRDRARRRGDGAGAQARRARHHRRAEPARSVSPAAGSSRCSRRWALRLWLRKVLLTSRAQGACSSAPGSLLSPRRRSSSSPDGSGCSTWRATPGVDRWPAVTGALVRPFVFLDRHLPAVRRHGYLLATVVTKPQCSEPNVISTAPRAD